MEGWPPIPLWGFVVDVSSVSPPIIIARYFSDRLADPLGALWQAHAVAQSATCGALALSKREPTLRDHFRNEIRLSLISCSSSIALPAAIACWKCWISRAFWHRHL